MKIFLLCAVLVVFSSVSASGQTRNIISDFNASFEKDELILNWSITAPESVSKFIVEKRKSSSEPGKKVAEVLFSNFRNKSESDSLLVVSYICSDKPSENGVYYYMLTAVDERGAPKVPTATLKIGITNVPEFKLKQNSPNPFNPSTTISYEVLTPSVIKITVFTLTGQFVDVLAQGLHTPGSYTVSFNAAKYPEISSGIYFYKLESEYSSDIRKMIFAK